MNILDQEGKTHGKQEERFEKTRTLRYDDSAQASHDLAQDVARLIQERQRANKSFVIGLATGSTPVPFYRELIRLHEEGLSFFNVITFNLDEYYGLASDHPESYRQFMDDQLFSKVDIPKENIHIPDGTVPLDEVYDFCLNYENAIDNSGGLDLQILGIGRTGHIGFNEPGSTEDSITRMITLDRVTRQDAAADFKGVANVPRSAITMGVGTILKARHIVLMAWGENKAQIVKEAVEGPVSDQVSASFLQNHSRSLFLIDQAASTRLTRFKQPWLVGTVDWDTTMQKRAVVWLSEKLDKPFLKLVDEDYNEAGAGELLASTSHHAYEVNIEIFNAVQRTVTGWPGGNKKLDESRQPEYIEPSRKKVLILSPEPADAILGMAGTIHRLNEQGHDVHVVCQTSGSLRVGDAAAGNFASVIAEMAEQNGETWSSQAAYAEGLRSDLRKKGEFGPDPKRVRELKGLILRGETRDSINVLRNKQGQSVTLRFLDLPFYEKGRYRRFTLKSADYAIMDELLREGDWNSIYATGDSSDPSSVQALCFSAFRSAWESKHNQCGSLEGEETAPRLRVWLYRGRDQELETQEIDMAVPMSPDQLGIKSEAIRKFNFLSEEEYQMAQRNRDIAIAYDQLGMAQYEAIEAFRKWRTTPA